MILRYLKLVQWSIKWHGVKKVVILHSILSTQWCTFHELYQRCVPFLSLFTVHSDDSSNGGCHSIPSSFFREVDTDWLLTFFISFIIHYLSCFLWVDTKEFYTRFLSLVFVKKRVRNTVHWDNWTDVLILILWPETRFPLIEILTCAPLDRPGCLRWAMTDWRLVRLG